VRAEGRPLSVTRRGTRPSTRPIAHLGALLLAWPLVAPVGTLRWPATAPHPSRAAPPPTCALILSTSDTHGHLLPWKPAWAHGRELGGAARLEGYFRRDEAASPCPAFRFSAGDLMQGTPISNLSAGRSTIAAFDSMGYDAAAVGNHEFDWGIDTLVARVRQARFPFLGANIYVRGTGRHPAWDRPWTVIERGGVRVGVVGVTTRSTPVTTTPAHVANLEFRSLAAAIDRYVPELRSRGVDFVVVLLHAGGVCSDHGRDCDGEALDALQATRSHWDYAIAGHTHTLIRTRVRGRPVVQSYANGTAYARERLTLRGTDSVDAGLPVVTTAWPGGARPDPAVARVVDRFESRVAERARRRVATLAAPLPKGSRGAEYALGDLVADAQRSATGAEIAIMNDGGLRASLPAGPVTYGELFELQPFGNGLVRLRLSGRLLRRTLEHALEEDGPHAHVSGLTVCYEPTAPAGRRIRALRLDDGGLVRPDSTYSVAVNDFMAAGGSGFSMLREAPFADRTGVLDLDALVAYLGDLPQPVRPPATGRWRSEGAAANGCPVLAAGRP
jgi:2',3'-cyclic-nucleotide 2'-phosphodiesterase (5'-nucleotidase family)